MSLLTLASVKPHLKIDQSTDDNVLQGKLDSAESYVSRELNGCSTLTSTVVTETVRGWNALALSKSPIISVTSVTGEVYGSFPVANLRVNLASGTIRAKAYTLPLRDDWYTVVYTSGYATAADVPPDLVEAVRLMTQHFYTTQRGGRKSVGGDSGTSTDAFSRAQQILDGRRIPGHA